MKILITGAKGFIGRNLCAYLRNLGYCDLMEYDIDTEEKLDGFLAGCEFVFHLAGINRPDTPEKFEDNHRVTQAMAEGLKRKGRKAPVLLSSSTQAALDNPYGISKRKAEKVLFDYGTETGVPVFIYRLPGVFGKWCRPNYNNVVATFCDSVATGKPLRIDDAEIAIPLVYIDDVVNEFSNALSNKVNRAGEYCRVEPVYEIKLGDLAKMISSFREDRKNLNIIDVKDAFTRCLYSTYLSYLPEDAFSYPLTAHSDERGCFAEFIRSESGGQVSVNVAKPGVIKGGHWHYTKTEKILVISGSGEVRFQKLGGEKIITCPVSEEELEVVDIPPGFVHEIINTGKKDMVMVIWASQLFDPVKPDTFPMHIRS